MSTQKKTTILDWVLRILFAFIILISLCLVMLNMISGNGEQQRLSLESAFTDALHVPVRIGQLNQFNAFPQFVIDVAELKSEANQAGKSIKADHVRVAFSSFEVFKGKQTIQKFDIANGELTLPQFSAKTFENINARIIPPTIQNNEAKFEIESKIDGKTATASIPMTHQKSGMDFNFAIKFPAVITIHYGACDMTGSIDAGNKFHWTLPDAPHKDCQQFIGFFQKP